MEKDKQKVPDAIRLLTMKVIDNSLNTQPRPQKTIYGCWKQQEDFYFDTEEELDNFRLKNQLVVFPTFKVEFFGSVLDFKDVIKITTMTDSKDGEKNTALPAFRGTTIYTPTFEDYEGNIVEEIIITKKVKFLYGDIHPHKIYRKLQEVGVELETINNDWLIEEQAAVLEDKLGMTRGKKYYSHGPYYKVIPKASIWGYLEEKNPEKQKWFMSRSEIEEYIPESGEVFKSAGNYVNIEFFGNIGDCVDVMRITKHSMIRSTFDIYTPTFDNKKTDYDSSYTKDNKRYLNIDFAGEINLTDVYDLLKENGITVETDYKNCGKREENSLVKKPNEVSTPTS